MTATTGAISHTRVARCRDEPRYPPPTSANPAAVLPDAACATLLALRHLLAPDDPAVVLKAAEMILDLEIDVPESHPVTLPPEVPVDTVKVVVQTTADVPALPDTSEKAERERAVFFRLLPELLKTRRDQSAL